MLAYSRPAGTPGVELGLLFDRQLARLFPSAMTYETTPPVPLPRASPPMRRNVVPARKDGVHENPVPVLPVGSTVIEPTGSGMTYDCPPGIIPKKFGVLSESVATQDLNAQQDTERVERRTPAPLSGPTIFV